MNKFIDYIFSLFVENEYELIYSHNIFKHKKYDDFWCVTEDANFYNKQADLYDSWKNFYVKYPIAEKNMSILLLVDEEFTLEQSIKIEKDPFFFKKYVLNYSEEAYRELRGLLESNKGIKISDLIMQESIYEQMMRSENNMNGASLLYAIIHKLPFIPVHVMQKNINDNGDFMPVASASLLSMINSCEDEEALGRLLDNLLNANENGKDQN